MFIALFLAIFRRLNVRKAPPPEDGVARLLFDRGERVGDSVAERNQFPVECLDGSGRLLQDGFDRGDQFGVTEEPSDSRVEHRPFADRRAALHRKRSAGAAVCLEHLAAAPVSLLVTHLDVLAEIELTAFGVDFSASITAISR